MKQSLIFMVILATFSMVNSIPHKLTKRDTAFGPCADGSPQITVALSPDPPLADQLTTFTITGTMPVDTGAQTVITFFDDTDAVEGDPISTDICSSEGVTCPETTLDFTQSVQMPATLPNSIQVQVMDQTGEILGCATGDLVAA
ncbi:hypothetical protein C1645_737323 [Glomus cerebriforme]|uniref:Uncharacterized protein n=1 Tax=Glomus cerebriforme TaxID=658196 RepID=A0A397T7X9_9GLOM|nr:hypothetical protein C1645_737323 [Glomus cerebriforme]